MSGRLRTKYPEEMTIVLQHQFWDLVVGDKGFEVGLSFNGVPERLAVPFEAIKGFFDPSVQFGLQFEEVAVAGEHSGQAEQNATGASNAPPVEPIAPAVAAVPVQPDPEAARTTSQAEPDKSAAGGEVVQLDRFRKK